MRSEIGLTQVSLVEVSVQNVVSQLYDDLLAVREQKTMQLL